MHYLFHLGHQPLISAAELEAVFASQQHNITTTYLAGRQAQQHKGCNYLIIDFENEIDAQKLINQLGGTIKIARQLQVISYKSQENIINYFTKIQPTGKIEFSLTGGDKKLALEIKKGLKQLGRSVRYIEPKNTATILYNKLVEKKNDLTIVDNKLFVTVAIQPFEEMSERDYGRPGSDNKSGMLPPKLARIMINLSQSHQNDTILDPFCGSGTILTEALTMGYTNLIGSDISPKAVADTKKNLKWIFQTYNLKPITYNLYNIDAQNLETKIKHASIDAIITEPYLGKPLHGNETDAYLKKQTTELKNLYLESFKSFHKILKPNGVVVFIIPRFYFGKNEIVINIKNDIATATAGSRLHGGKKIGFTIVPFVNLKSFPPQRDPSGGGTILNLQSLTYHRPNQHLAREIWRFKKI